jgi:hypothetical protein
MVIVTVTVLLAMMIDAVFAAGLAAAVMRHFTNVHSLDTRRFLTEALTGIVAIYGAPSTATRALACTSWPGISPACFHFTRNPLSFGDLYAMSLFFISAARAVAFARNPGTSAMKLHSDNMRRAKPASTGSTGAVALPARSSKAGLIQSSPLM